MSVHMRTPIRENSESTQETSFLSPKIISITTTSIRSKEVELHEEEKLENSPGSLNKEIDREFIVGKELEDICAVKEDGTEKVDDDNFDEQGEIELKPIENEVMKTEKSHII